MLEIGIFIAVFIVLIYIWLTWNYNHWKKLKIPYIEPNLFYGNIKDFVLLKKCKGLVYDDLYWKRNEPAIGVFAMRQPQWLIRDPELVKKIKINEHSNFRENDVYTEESDFFFATNVFFFSGEKWKKKRSMITPALSMAKLKLFLPHMVEISREMFQYLDDNGDKPLEAKIFSSLYTMESAMSYVYGVKVGSFKDPNTKFKHAFNEIFDPTFFKGLKFAIANAFPPVGHFFKIGLTPDSFVKFYMNVVKETVDFKKKTESKRKDFLQYLIDISGKDGSPELSIYDMTALTMNLAADGSETTSAGLQVVIDALIRNPEHQAKLREEIDSKISCLEDVTYENINSMPYLTAFISESLRVLTPIPMLEIKCTNSCEITHDDIKYRFKTGDKIALSMYSNHRDPKYFPNPNKFEPERFINNPDPIGFAPFGLGPRMCLGRTFAYVQMKVFLCALLKYYEVLPKDKVAPPIEYDPNSQFFLMVKGGVWFRAIRRRDV